MVISSAGDRTLSVALTVFDVSPGPVQYNLLVWFLVRLVSTRLPRVARVAPSSVQPVAFVELQVKVEDPP